MDRQSYEFFSGFNQQAEPTWSRNIGDSKPVFQHPNKIGFGVRVFYNPGLKRYLLTKPHYTENDNQEAWEARNSGISSLGIFDAPEPWGPWTRVLPCSLGI